MITSGCPEKVILPKPLHVYVRHSVVPTSLPADPVWTIVDHVSLLSSTPMISDPLSPTVETDPSTSSDLDLPIAFRKGK